MNLTHSKEKIIKTAIFLFGSYGKKKTSMEMIAKAARVSKPLLFHHFGTRDKLLKACEQYVQAQMVLLSQIDTKGLGFYSMLTKIYEYKLNLETLCPGFFAFVSLDQLKAPILPPNPMTRADKAKLKPGVNPDHVWETLYYLTLGYQSALQNKGMNGKDLFIAFETSLRLFANMTQQ
jgi:AcrR family transcriptional regulator